MITYFHRNKEAGYSIDKVTQSYVRYIPSKEEFYVPYRRASLMDILNNLWFVFRNRNTNGINHITGDIHYCILALIGCKSVLTIHDTAIVDFNEQSKLARAYHKWLWYVLPLMIATKVVCISESTKTMIQRYTRRKDILVIHNAIDPSIKTSLKEQFVQPRKVLFIGTNPNKNLPRTIKALEGIDCELTIIGELNKELEDLLRTCKIEYINKKNLTDEEMSQEYVATDIVSFVSLYEGFGMPIIEANMVGRPVITASLPVLKEVAGDSAVFVDPYDINDIRNGFIRLFTDADLRQRCIKKGLENVKRFSVSDIQKQYTDIYEDLKCK